MTTTTKTDYLDEHGHDNFQYGVARLAAGKGISRDHVAYDGLVIFHFPANEFFGGEGSKSYTTKVLDSPTWEVVLVEVDNAIKRTKDKHHCFLEIVAYEYHGMTKDDIPIWEPFLGS